MGYRKTTSPKTPHALKSIDFDNIDVPEVFKKKFTFGLFWDILS